MACTEWEESGLLFLSGELSEGERTRLQAHLQECETCNAAHERAMHEKENYFCATILGAAPSAECDRRILDVCGKGVRPTAIPFWSVIMRKGVVSALLLLLGFGGAAYFTYIFKNSASTRTHIAVPQKDPAFSQDAVVATTADSTFPDTTDSLQPTQSVPFAKTMGNVTGSSVTTVDVQKR